VGPAGRGQRRAAVRAPMDYRVSLTAEGRTFEGVSVDLSEGGVRCVLDDPALGTPGPAGKADPSGAAAEASPTATSEQRLEVGSIQQVTVWFDERENVTAKAEVIRHHPRADGWEEVSLRFIGLPEKMEDLIRGRVFSRLRDLRARGML
jgi:c-di-GMP-binding flagellar brake protein YcgR